MQLVERVEHPGQGSLIRQLAKSVVTSGPASGVYTVMVMPSSRSHILAGCALHVNPVRRRAVEPGTPRRQHVCHASLYRECLGSDTTKSVIGCKAKDKPPVAPPAWPRERQRTSVEMGKTGRREVSAEGGF